MLKNYSKLMDFETFAQLWIEQEVDKWVKILARLVFDPISPHRSLEQLQSLAENVRGLPEHVRERVTEKVEKISKDV